VKERIFILSPDDNAPIGGVKQLYRQVDVLVKHGLYARVLHRKKGYHCTWFENNTPVISWSEFEWTDDDIIVLPEIYGPGMTKTLVVDKHRTLFSPSRFWQEELRPKMRKVIFNQNGYHTFARYGFSGSGRETPYLDPMVVATIVVSEDSREFVKAVFPEHNVLRVHNAINPSLFSYVENKKKQICFMTRKHRDEVEQVINIAKFHGALEGYSLHPIEHASEREVARIMSESLIFLSFGYPVGF
jgi:hypothetical protein